MGRKLLSEVEPTKAANARPRPKGASAPTNAITPHGVATLAGIPLTLAQRTVLKSFWGEPLDADELAMFRTLTGNERAKPNPGGTREAWVCAGRRGGKTTRIAAPCAVAAALDTSLRVGLAPGERLRILTIAPTIEHTRQDFHAIKGLLAVLGIPHTARDGDLEIELSGAPVLFQSAVATALGPRSGTAGFVVIDEAALLPTTPEAVGYDKDVIASVKPALATTGGRLLVLSSPWAQAGEHYRLTVKERGKATARRVSFWGPTWIWNPSLTEAMTHELEEDLRRWQREYAALAGATEDSYFAPTDIDAVVDTGVRERPPVPGQRYAAGLDVAFRRDRTVLTIGHREYRAQLSAPPLDVIVVDLIRVWKPTPGVPLDFDKLMAEVAAIVHRYRDPKVGRDAFASDAVLSALKQRGIASAELSMAPASQALRFDMLAQRIATSRFRLVDEPIAIEELKGLRVKLHAGGRIEIAAPNRSGAHDDCADSIALMVELAAKLPAGGDIRCEPARFVWNGAESGAVGEPQWTQRVIWEDGSERWVACAPPQDTPDWHRYVATMAAQGLSTPEIERWREAQRRAVLRVLNVDIDLGGRADNSNDGETNRGETAEQKALREFVAGLKRTGTG
ncbi:MAG: hypothetical protein HY898_02265 [Deltaproteobacteria bacterium]|nr:hypothetical protein [Deltaproteobacteria bacterium]